MKTSSEEALLIVKVCQKRKGGVCAPWHEELLGPLMAKIDLQLAICM